MGDKNFPLPRFTDHFFGINLSFGRIVLCIMNHLHLALVITAVVGIVLAEPERESQCLEAIKPVIAEMWLDRRECRMEGKSGMMEMNQCISGKRGWNDPDTGGFCLEAFEESAEAFLEEAGLSDEQEDALRGAVGICMTLKSFHFWHRILLPMKPR